MPNNIKIIIILYFGKSHSLQKSVQHLTVPSSHNNYVNFYKNKTPYPLVNILYFDAQQGVFCKVLRFYYDIMIFRTCLLLIFIFLTNETSAQKHTLRGTIRERTTGEPIPGVNILIADKQAGTVSDSLGAYKLKLKEGKYTLTFSFLGYAPKRKTILMNGDKMLDIQLSYAGIMLNETVVREKKVIRHVESTETNAILLEIESVRNMPSFLGEVDVLRAVQMMPGIQSAGDGNTGFSVRGGNADQNLVLLDDAVIFNASHLFNVFSVFNSDAIKDLKLYKGGIEPSYGGRLSSVVDIKMKEGDLRNYQMNGGVGLISSRLTVEGPLQYGQSAFLLSGRRTYADLFLKLSSDENQRNTRLYFYDLNLKMNYLINEKNRIYISGYLGRDITVMSNLFGLDWGNTVASIRWNRFFNDNFYANFSFVVSKYQFNISGDVGRTSFLWNSLLSNINIKSDFNLKLNDKSNLTFGWQSIYHNLQPGNITAKIQGAINASINLTDQNGLEHGLYANNKQHFINDKLIVNYGLRASFFQTMGPGNQYIYDKTDPMKWQIEDSISLGKGHFYDIFFALEPRLSFRYLISQRQSIKGSYNRMTQYIQQAQSAQSVAPYDVWYTASNNIPPQQSDQYSLGYFQSFFSHQVETSLELFYKDMKNICDIIDNGNLIGNEYLEREIRTGRGWAYGLEVLIQKQKGSLQGFIGYTWALAQRQTDGINQGLVYYAPNDRRHDLSLSGNYTISPKWIVGINFVYATGSAFTMPIGKMFYQSSFAPIYADRNSSRLPHYHRMDLSLTFNPELENREERRFTSSWNFSLFNVYGRTNPISVSFAQKEGKPHSSFFYIPGPVPSITWNFNL